MDTRELIDMLYSPCSSSNLVDSSFIEEWVKHMDEKLDLERAFNDLEKAYTELSYKSARLMEENENMRTQLARIRLFGSGLNTIKHYADMAFSDVFFWIGFAVAAFIVLLSGSIYNMRELIKGTPKLHEKEKE